MRKARRRGWARPTNRVPRRPAPQPTDAGRSWYRIENKAGSETEVYLYDEIGMWGVSAADFVNELKAVTSKRITLRLNSPGGEIFDGIAIYNALLTHAAEITVHIDGLAASAASFIAQAGDKVIIDRHAQMMIHDGQGICVGDSRDMRALADLLDRSSDNIASIYAERAGGTVTAWRDRMREETWYSAQEAVDAGLADEVANPVDTNIRPARRDQANTWDLSVFRYAGRGAAPAPEKTEPAARPTNRAPAQPAPAPATEPNPATIRFDPAVFRDAVTTGVEQLDGYDPAVLRAAVTLGVNDVPAPDTPSAPPPPADEPAIRFDARDLMRALREGLL